MAQLDLGYNQLTNFTLPAWLTNLTYLGLEANKLTSLTLPTGLRSLTYLSLELNPFTSITLPTGLTSLTRLGLDGNLLKTLVLPEPLAATNLAATVSSLRTNGVSVYTYPLALSLVSPQITPTGPFDLTLAGPPAVYTILSSTDLAAWNQVGTLTNTLGATVFTDARTTNSPSKFYRAVSR